MGKPPAAKRWQTFFDATSVIPGTFRPQIPGQGKTSGTPMCPQSFLNAVAIGLAAAGTVAFAKIHPQQACPAGGTAPKNKQTTDQFEKPAQHLVKKTDPGNSRPEVFQE